MLGNQYTEKLNNCDKLSINTKTSECLVLKEILITNEFDILG